MGTDAEAALVSLVVDDRSVERSPIAKHVSREIFTQDYKAAVAHAFTAVEDHLKEKVGPDS